MEGGSELGAFAAFGLAAQTILLAYFAARRWLPAAAGKLGWVAYAFGALGGLLALWLLLAGASWRLFAGPALWAAWAAFGAWADLWRRIPWRQPVVWAVFGPYVTLYLAAQMFLWWPLWNLWRPGWVLFLLLFAANTALNLAGHGPAPTLATRRST